LRAVDGQGLARTDPWISGAGTAVPASPHPNPPPQAGEGMLHGAASDSPLPRLRGRVGVGAVQDILDRAVAGKTLAEAEIVRLFQARGDDFAAVCEAADKLRRAVNGDTVTYVVTR